MPVDATKTLDERDEAALPEAETAKPRIQSAVRTISILLAVADSPNGLRAKEIMDKYTKQKAGRSGGREGLGIYGQFQSRAAREKLRLAERLLKSAGLPTDDATVRKVMRQ